jgi:uroporphyrinogen III methyltransferase/synthase
MVYLVGAGPGDKDLITLKGVECIKNAEVIIFDHLVNPTLLNDAPTNCRLIYVGKISGNHHLAQEETNSLLVKYGLEGKNVVRLKGGDPFVFGRGGEEAQVLAENGISFEIVPGVSSCYSAAAYAGIPVTHRNSASSFHVITGYEKNEKIDYNILAREEGTLVFMMGLKSLPRICEKLMNGGKNPQTPAAVISNGTLQSQRCFIGTLDTITEIAKDAPMPAVVIVGDVINEKTEWFSVEKNLRDTKIISTATKAVSKNIREEIEKYGGELIEMSLIKTVPINFDCFKKLDLSSYSHIVFSSVGGVEIFFEYLRDTKTDVRSLHKIKFAAVGKKTADYLSERGIYTDYVPEKYNSNSLSSLLENNLNKTDKVLLLRADKASQVIPEMLDRNGVEYTDLPIYRTEANYEKAEALELYAKDADYIIFSSGSAANAFKKIIGDTKINCSKFISIGEQTTKSAEKVGIEIYKTAETADAEGIVKCILDDIEHGRNTK